MPIFFFLGYNQIVKILTSTGEFLVVLHVTVKGSVTMPPIDCVLWLFGRGNIPLSEWLAHKTITQEPGVRSPARPSVICHISI